MKERPTWEECERKFWQYAAAMEYGIPGDIRKYGREYKAMLAAYEANEAKEPNAPHEPRRDNE